jgi:hypothetical protein
MLLFGGNYSGSKSKRMAVGVKTGGKMLHDIQVLLSEGSEKAAYSTKNMSAVQKAQV